MILRLKCLLTVKIPGSFIFLIHPYRINSIIANIVFGDIIKTPTDSADLRGDGRATVSVGDKVVMSFSLFGDLVVLLLDEDIWS